MRTRQALPEVRLGQHVQSPSLQSTHQHCSELVRELTRALEKPISAGRGRRLAARDVLYSQSSEKQKRGPRGGLSVAWRALPLRQPPSGLSRMRAERLVTGGSQTGQCVCDSVGWLFMYIVYQHTDRFSAIEPSWDKPPRWGQDCEKTGGRVAKYSK